jgi:NAD(P)-dependent dehydrogenase (short-subunit alcohol dehydrogenase family)
MPLNLQPTALITGASKGLGLALARGLTDRGWRLVIDARNSTGLSAAAAQLPSTIAVRGDVKEAAHREQLRAAVGERLDLLVNNASELGPSPLPPLARYPLDALRAVYETNVVAPLALTQLLLPHVRAAGGVVLNISSDAAVEAYPGWGGYGSAKAALDHLSAVLAAVEPDIRCYAVDPGDLRTDMHQAAFPGEDISDRPLPDTIVPAFMRLLEVRPPSGRYRASELAAKFAAEFAAEFAAAEAAR